MSRLRFTSFRIHFELVALLSLAHPTGAAQGQLTSTYIPNNNNSGTWHNTDRWDNAHIPNAIDDGAIFNHPIDSGAAGTGNYSLSLDGMDTTVGSIVSNNTTNNYHFQITNGNLIFQSNSGMATYTESAFTTGTPTAPGSRFAANVTLNSDLTYTLNALALNSQAEISGILNGSADRKLIKEGDGNLQLASGITPGAGEGFLGEFIINHGAIRVIQSPPISQAKGVTVNAGGQLQLANAITDFSLGSGVLKLNGNGKAAGASVDGALRFQLSGTTTSTFHNPVVLESSSRVTVPVAGTTGILDAEVSGVGQLIKTGLSALKLTANNSYQGGTSVNNGSLTVEGGTADLGSGNVTVLGSAANATFLKIDAGVANAIADSATLDLAGGGTLVGTADQGYLDLGIDETVGGLILGGTPMAAGVYGSTSSGAAIPMDEYFTGAGKLTVLPGFLEADFDNSGEVDDADFATWVGGFGNATGQLKANGNADVGQGDEDVDGADFLVWQQQFGSPGLAVGASGAIPEPNAALLLAFAAPLTSMFRRKR